jgi:hypothetical protein
MSAKAKKRAGKREQILVLVEQLQQLQPSDTAAAAGIANQTCEALRQLQSSVLDKDRAVGCLPAILQCFCWLAEAWVVVATRNGDGGDGSALTSDVEAVWLAWPMCLQAAAQILENGVVPIDTLRAILRRTNSSSSSSDSSSSSKSSTSTPGECLAKCLHPATCRSFVLGGSQLCCRWLPVCVTAAAVDVLLVLPVVVMQADGVSAGPTTQH